MEALAEWRYLLLGAKPSKFGWIIRTYNTSDNLKNLITDKPAGLQN